MSEEKTRTNIKTAELKPGMVISAYTGFHQKYQSLDLIACKFLQHNFKKAKTVVVRNKQKLQIPIESLQENDRLLRIYGFPPELKKLLIVNEKLIGALTARGFLEFDVSIEPFKKASQVEPTESSSLVKQVDLSPGERKQHYQKAKTTAEKFVHTLKENLVTREKTSRAIENIMDNARRGDISHESINEYVEAISKNTSAEAMSAIVSLRESDQTYDHCVDVGVIFQSSYLKIVQSTNRPSVFESESNTLLAAFLHDFGKSKIPKAILDSAVRFDRDSHEMKLMESHPALGAELLAGMNMPESFINMAHYHHVKQDTTMNTCYPKNVAYDKVMYESRLLAIIDAYQALVGKRKYKKSWNPPAAIRYIDALAGVEFDMDAWLDFLNVVGLFPKGSLVELNDKSIGFVISTPKEDLKRPQIVVMKNAAGEDLTHHTLIDLELERDIIITRELDIDETFGTDALNKFTSIQIV